MVHAYRPCCRWRGFWGRKAIRTSFDQNARPSQVVSTTLLIAHKTRGAEQQYRCNPPQTFKLPPQLGTLRYANVDTGHSIPNGRTQGTSFGRIYLILAETARQFVPSHAHASGSRPNCHGRPALCDDATTWACTVGTRTKQPMPTSGVITLWTTTHPAGVARAHKQETALFWDP